MKQILLFLLGLFFVVNALNAQTNLFPAGDFESGIDDWTTKWNQKTEGTFTLTDDAVSGTNAGLVDVTANNSNITKVVIVSPLITEGINDRSSYLVSATMKSDLADNEMKMQLLANDAEGNPRYMTSPKDENGEFFHLSTEYQNYKWIASVNKEGYGTSAQFRLQCAKYIAKYYIDDIQLYKIEGVENGDFEDENLDYAYNLNVNTDAGAAAEFSYDTENVNNGSGALKAMVTASKDTAGHVSIVTNTRLYPDLGEDYEFEFYAKSESGSDSLYADVNLYMGDNTFVGAQTAGFKLGSEYQKYAVGFTMPDTLWSAKFKLNFGAQVGTIYVDDIVMKEATVVPNDLPEASDNSFEVDKNNELSEDVSANDVQSDDGGNVYTIESQPENGTVSMNADGTFTYTPSTDYVGSDSFSYTLCDTDSDCVTATVSIEVKTPVSSSDIQIKELKVYPNPANEILFIENAKQVELFNMIGKLVKKVELNGKKSSIAIGDLDQGLYLLRADDTYVKIVKQ